MLNWFKSPRAQLANLNFIHLLSACLKMKNFSIALLVPLFLNSALAADISRSNSPVIETKRPVTLDTLQKISELDFNDSESDFGWSEDDTFSLEEISKRGFSDSEDDSDSSDSDAETHELPEQRKRPRRDSSTTRFMRKDLGNLHEVDISESSSQNSIETEDSDVASPVEKRTKSSVFGRLNSFHSNKENKENNNQSTWMHRDDINVGIYEQSE